MTVNTLGGEVHAGKAAPARWLWPLLPIAVATFALSALVSYHLRADGGEARSALQGLIMWLYRTLGFVPSFLFFLLVLSWSSIWFVTGTLERPLTRLLRVCGLTLAMAIWVNVRADGQPPLPSTGALGAWLSDRLVGTFGYLVSTLIAAPVAIAALLLATDFFFYRYFEGLGTARAARSPGPRSQPEAADLGVEAEVADVFKSLARAVPDPVALPLPQRSSAAPASPAAAVEPEPAAPPMARRERRWGGHEGRGTGQDDEFAIAAAAFDAVGEPLPEPAAAAAGEAAVQPADEGAGSSRRRGRLSPLVTSEEDGPMTELPDLPTEPEPLRPEVEAEAPDSAQDIDGDAGVPDAAGSDGTGSDRGSEAVVEVEAAEVVPEPGPEPAVAIPRPAEGVRQQRLFLTVDEALVREAVDVVMATRRASVTHLQRQLRVDYDQAIELLGILSRRGVIDWAEGETQGRVR